MKREPYGIHYADLWYEVVSRFGVASIHRNLNSAKSYAHAMNIAHKNALRQERARVLEQFGAAA